jgi:ABC-type sulfate transport system substrate-binding protein
MVDLGAARWGRWVRGALPVAILGALLLYSVWPWLPLPRHEQRVRTIVFYGFSIIGEAMTQDVFPAFQAEWRARTSEHVEFSYSFAGSVPHHGTVNCSPFVILVRGGNPKGVRDFEDLAGPGVKVVHPDPLTSGGANWSILAEYGAAVRRHPDDPDAGHGMLLGIWRNVVAQAASARAARTQFQNGFGDALVTYEQDGLLDLSRGKLDTEIVYPRSTILSEHTLVMLERNVRPSERELVQAFVDFLWSEPAQRLFVKHGFRSVDDALNASNPAFGRIEDPFRVADLGGWKQARHDIVDGVWKNRVLKELAR